MSVEYSVMVASYNKHHECEFLKYVYAGTKKNVTAKARRLVRKYFFVDALPKIEWDWDGNSGNLFLRDEEYPSKSISAKS